METLNTKNNMTVVHLAFGASKPVVPFTDRKMSFGKIADPSSVMRSENTQSLVLPKPGLIPGKEITHENTGYNLNATSTVAFCLTFISRFPADHIHFGEITPQCFYFEIPNRMQNLHSDFFL